MRRGPHCDAAPSEDTEPAPATADVDHHDPRRDRGAGLQPGTRLAQPPTPLSETLLARVQQREEGPRIFLHASVAVPERPHHPDRNCGYEPATVAAGATDADPAPARLACHSAIVARTAARAAWCSSRSRRLSRCVAWNRNHVTMRALRWSWATSSTWWSVSSSSVDMTLPLPHPASASRIRLVVGSAQGRPAKPGRRRSRARSVRRFSDAKGAARTAEWPSVGSRRRPASAAIRRRPRPGLHRAAPPPRST